MNCAHGVACKGAVRPWWIRSVGIPLCERHLATVRAARRFEPKPDPKSLQLLIAVAVVILRAELTSREPTHV